MSKIVIVDDDEDVLDLLDLLLTTSGHDVARISDSSQIFEVMRLVEPDLVITDILMPGLSGGMVYMAIRKEFGTHIPIIIHSGSSIKVTSQNDPLLAYCPKPMEQACMLETIERLCAASKNTS